MHARKLDRVSDVCLSNVHLDTAVRLDGNPSDLFRQELRCCEIHVHHHDLLGPVAGKVDAESFAYAISTACDDANLPLQREP
jgi:hypothetical protein